MEIDKLISVLDKTDIHPYSFMVIDANEEDKIKIHFVNWNVKFDEWISKNSNRILTHQVVIGFACFSDTTDRIA